MRSRLRAGSLWVSVVFSTSAASVIAQAVEVAQADQQSKAGDKVIVNARLWDETAQEVPDSLVLVEGDVFEDRGIELLESRVANVRIERSSVQTRVVTRGLAGIDTGLQDPLAWYLNGVALPQGANQLPQLFDVAQLEFLKGPQGALYGRNSEAGLVKISTLAPDWNTRLKASLSSSWVDGADGEALGQVLGLRASDTLVDERLAGSLALRLEDSQGPYKNLQDGSNDGGEQNSWTASVGLTFNSGEQTLVDWRSVIEEKDRGRSQMRYITGANATDRFTTNYNSATFDNTETGVHSLTIEHSFDELILTATTGYVDYQREFQADLDSSPMPAPETLMDMDDEMLSQELRLSSNQQLPVRWLVGFYAYTQATDIDFRLGAPRATRITAIDQDGLALFGQIEFALTDKLALALSARAEQNDQSGEQSFAQTMASASYEADQDADKFLPKASLHYSFSDTSRLYLTAARGYLPGGYNYAFANSLPTFTYKEETSDNIELGYKYAGERLNLSAAGFYIETQDKHIVDVEPGNIQRISNAAKTESYGLELALDYQLTSRLTAYTTLGVMEAEAKEYWRNIPVGTSLVATNQAGNRLPMAAEQTYAAGIKYRAASQGVFFSVGMNGSGDYYFDSLNQLRQPSYQQWEAELGYQFRHVEVSLAGYNLGDEEIYSRSVATPTGVIVEDTAPRTLTFSISTDW